MTRNGLGSGIGVTVSEIAIRVLAGQMVGLLTERGIRPKPPSAFYQLPDADGFPIYLNLLDQLLSMYCGFLEGSPPETMRGERSNLDLALHLCLATPRSVSMRTLLAQMVRTVRHIKPVVIDEFADRLARLHQLLVGDAEGAPQHLELVAVAPCAHRQQRDAEHGEHRLWEARHQRHQQRQQAGDQEPGDDKKDPDPEEPGLMRQPQMRCTNRPLCMGK